MWYRTTPEDLLPKYKYLFPHYYNLSDNLFKYANYLKIIPSRNGFYNLHEKLPHAGSVEESLVVTIVKLL